MIRSIYNFIDYVYYYSVQDKKEGESIIKNNIKGK